MSWRHIAILNTLLVAALLSAFAYTGDGSNGFVTGEDVTAANMNEIDTALDALEQGGKSGIWHLHIRAYDTGESGTHCAVNDSGNDFVTPCSTRRLTGFYPGQLDSGETIHIDHYSYDIMVADGVAADENVVVTAICTGNDNTSTETMGTLATFIVDSATDPRGGGASDADLGLSCPTYTGGADNSKATTERNGMGVRFQLSSTSTATATVTNFEAQIAVAWHVE